MNTANAINQLEQVAQKNSDSEKALRDAATALACWVEKQISKAGAVGRTLPRGYEVRKVTSNVGYEYFLFDGYEDCGPIDGMESYLHGDFHCWTSEATHEQLLNFANDVGTGWLAELTEWLADRAEESQKATNAIQAAQ